MGEIDVANDLRQGCTVQYIYIYTCLVVERWSARMSIIDGIGVRVKYKVNGKLFRRYTKNGSDYTLRECQFADC